jgi:hypothetical protein
MPTVLVSQQLPTPRPLLRPVAGSPWLENPRPAQGARTALLIGLACALVGGIGGGLRQGLEPWAAALLLLGGVMVTLGAAVQWMNAVARQHAEQVCPACLCSMARGATTCPWCQHTPRG